MSDQLDYIFPLRPNFNAQLVVPRDMTTLEAERLAAFLLTLVVPERSEQEGEERQ